MEIQRLEGAFKKAYQGLRQFMFDLFCIENERKILIEEVLEEAKQKKMEEVKQHISDLK